MPFKKGEVNSNGRPPGSQNKKTVEHLKRSARLREMIEQDPRFQKDMIAGLTVKEMASIYLDLIEYEEPKLGRVEHIGDQNNTIIVLPSAPPVRQLPTNTEDIPHTEVIKAIPITNNPKPF